MRRKFRQYARQIDLGPVRTHLPAATMARKRPSGTGTQDLSDRQVRDARCFYFVRSRRDHKYQISTRSWSILARRYWSRLDVRFPPPTAQGVGLAAQQIGLSMRIAAVGGRNRGNKESRSQRIVDGESRAFTREGRRKLAEEECCL